MDVAIQGEVGSFSDEAALKLLGSETRIVGFRHFDEVFRAVSSGEVEAAVVPLENTLTGSIHRNYDLLRRHGLKIHGELYLPIVHNLIVLPGVHFEDIRRVISHPVALGQCESFLERYPNLTSEATYDTSGSVKEIVDRDLRDYAAIAGKRASEVFGGQILMEGIQDSDDNYTRFVLLSREAGARDGDKTSIVFSHHNVAGALFKSLSVFALRDIDLTKIESRPFPGRAWRYLFYIDFLGSLKEERVQRALSHLQELTDLFEILGCYPRDPNIVKKGI
jgi:prephenate dehydratase